MTEPARHPIDFIAPVDNEERSRALAALGIFFVKALLLVPHLILLSLYAVAVQVIVWIGYWYILITGEMPFWVLNLENIFLEWTSRVFAWFTSVTDAYPTFGTDEHHPAQIEIAKAGHPRSRWLALAGILLIRSIMAIPHLFILAWLTLGTLFLAWLGYVLILINGRLPLELHWYFVGFHRWWARTWAWIAAITDVYPPFTLRR